MSELGSDTPAVEKSKDPLVRFLWGCALVAAVLAALVVGLALAVGWQLTRDEAPGRPIEAFLLGDEARYWRVDLKPDDAGLAALLARFNEINDDRRRALLEGTFLEHVPIPSRQARLSDLAPLTLELALVMSDPADGPQVPVAWTARGTLSRGLWKARAALKLIGWVARPGATEGGRVDVDGIAVTRVGPGFALSTVGNRVLAASDGDRMRHVLQSARGPSPLEDPRLAALHETIRSPGEDAWAFTTGATVAAASFDVTEGDDLVFRVAMAEGGAFDASREACLALVSTFLPRMPLDAIEIDGTGGTTFTGRITGLSKRFAALVELRTSPRWPSAIPTPPSPPPPADPRSGTPGAPPREGSPKTPR